MIAHDCPVCGRRMQSPESLVGQTERCPGCGASVRVRAAPASVPPAPPAPAPAAPPPLPAAYEPYPAPPPPPPGRIASGPWINPITEFGVFAMIFPVLMAGVSAFTFLLLSGPNPPLIMGISRGVFFGVPIFCSAAVSLIAGILLLVTKKSGAVIGCVVGGTLIAVSYLVTLTIATGRVPVDLMTAAMIAVPVLLIVRCPKAIAEIRRLRAASAGPPPQA